MSEKEIRIERTTVLDEGDGVSNYFSIYIGDNQIYTITLEELIRLHNYIERVVQHEEEYKAIEAKIEKGGQA